MTFDDFNLDPFSQETLEDHKKLLAENTQDRNASLQILQSCRRYALGCMAELDFILNNLEGDELTDQQTLQHVFERIGQPAIPMLIKATDHRCLATREVAATALISIAEDSWTNSDNLLRTDDKKIPLTHPLEAVRHVIKFLTSEHEDMRKTALWGVGSIGVLAKDALPIILKLSRPVAKCNSTTFTTLRQIEANTEEATQLGIDYLKMVNAETNLEKRNRMGVEECMAFLATTSVAGDDVYSLLLPLTKHNYSFDDDVNFQRFTEKAAALYAIGKLCSKSAGALDLLYKIMNDKEDFCRLGATKGLMAARSDRNGSVCQTILSFLKNPDEKIREDTLGSIPEYCSFASKIIPELKRLVAEDSSHSVKTSAKITLDNLLEFESRKQKGVRLD